MSFWTACVYQILSQTRKSGSRAPATDKGISHPVHKKSPPIPRCKPGLRRDSLSISTVILLSVWTHSQLPLQVRGGLGNLALLPALHGAHGAEVAPRRVAVVLQHLVLVLRTFPLLEVGHGVHQGVSSEHRQVLVVLGVLFTHRDLTLQTGLDGLLSWPPATVAANLDCRRALRTIKRKLKKNKNKQTSFTFRTSRFLPPRL